MATTPKELERYLVQLRRIEEHREAGAEKQIRKLYKSLLKDVQGFLAEQYATLAENDELTFELLQQKGDYARFLEEVEQRLNGITPKAAQVIRETVEETYAAMYNGMIDAVIESTTSEELHAALHGLQSATPEVIKRAIENPVAGLTLNDRLEKNRRDIIYNIKQQIGVGLTVGDRFSTMARRISEQLDGDYNKAIRIVRTETHRVREAGAQDSAAPIQEKLKEANEPYRLVKVWRTMGDERVRPQKRYKTKKGWKTSKSRRGPNHVKMNGQTVLMEEMFDLGNGVKAIRPGSSGVAGHDINCRCKCLEKLMDDEEFFEATGRHFENKPRELEKVNYSGEVTQELEENFESYISKIPDAHRQLAETQLTNIEVTSSKIGSSYSKTNKTIKISQNSAPDAIIHEYAHALETAVDAYNDPEFIKILHKGLENVTIDDIIYDEDNFTIPIYRVKCSKFVSLYQGRLYEEYGIYDGNNISIDGMQEYFAEGYREYVMRPENLKAHDPDLFGYFERIK